MPNKTKQNTKNSTEQICSQPLYKSQTTHHTHPHQQQAGWLRGQPPQHVADAHTVLNVNPTVCLLVSLSMPNPQSRTHTHHPHRVAYTCRHKKTTQHTNQQKGTKSFKSISQYCLQRSKMLASTIQFTTNTPTPNKQPQLSNHSYRWGQVRSAAPEPRQHAKPLKNPVPLCQKRQSQKSLNESLTVNFLPFQNKNSLERR